jgi:hypothetical protein
LRLVVGYRKRRYEVPVLALVSLSGWELTVAVSKLERE